MCLIITAAAAALTIALYFASSKLRSLKIGVAALCYAGASIMWLCDSFFAAAKGEPFFDISADDTMLGLLILVCGLVIWGVTVIIKKPQKA